MDAIWNKKLRTTEQERDNLATAIEEVATKSVEEQAKVLQQILGKDLTIDSLYETIEATQREKEALLSQHAIDVRRLEDSNTYNLGVLEGERTANHDQSYKLWLILQGHTWRIDGKAAVHTRDPLVRLRCAECRETTILIPESAVSLFIVGGTD